MRAGPVGISRGLRVLRRERRRGGALLSTAEQGAAFVPDPRHIVAVTGIVRHEGRVLLVRTHRRAWEPPGGQVELGEDLPAALVREVEEESGCVVSVDRLVGVYSSTRLGPQVIFAFLCSYLGGEPRPSRETPEVGWYAPDEALRMVTHPAQLGRLRDALGFDGRIVYRAYRTTPYVVNEERVV